MSAPHQQPAQGRSPAPHEDPTPPDARRVEPSSQRMAEGAQKLSESGIPQALADLAHAGSIPPGAGPPPPISSSGPWAGR